jgi:hypothetical protein
MCYTQPHPSPHLWLENVRIGSSDEIVGLHTRYWGTSQRPLIRCGQDGRIAGLHLFIRLINNTSIHKMSYTSLDFPLTLTQHYKHIHRLLVPYQRRFRTNCNKESSSGESRDCRSPALPFAPHWRVTPPIAPTELHVSP